MNFTSSLSGSKRHDWPNDEAIHDVPTHLLPRQKRVMKRCRLIPLFPTNTRWCLVVALLGVDCLVGPPHEVSRKKSHNYERNKSFYFVIKKKVLPSVFQSYLNLFE